MKQGNEKKRNGQGEINRREISANVQKSMYRCKKLKEGDEDLTHTAVLWKNIAKARKT